MTLRSGSNRGGGDTKFRWKWTEDQRLQLIQVVTNVERQRLKRGDSRLGKWKIIKGQLKNFSVSFQNRSEGHFSNLYTAYKKLRKQKSLSSISFPSVGPIRVSEKMFVKFREYDTMLEAYDGNAVKLTNHIEGPSQTKVSCSEDDVDVNVDDDQSISLSPPFTGYKDSTWPAVLQCVSDSKGSQDALAHEALVPDGLSEETKGVWRDVLLASGVPQGGGLKTSECSLADSLPYTRPSTKRPRERQNLMVNREVLEGLLDTWLEEKGNTKAHVGIVLKGLLEEKQIVKKVREISRDPHKRGRVSESTSVDKEIQELALKQMQLTVQAMYEKIKKQMTEMVEQTNQDVLSIVGQFYNSFTSI